VRRHRLRDSREEPNHGVQHSEAMQPLRGFEQTLLLDSEELSHLICVCHELPHLIREDVLRTYSSPRLLH
jgi:hypothetical protein